MQHEQPEGYACLHTPTHGEGQRLMVASILSRQSHGGAAVSKAGNGEQAKAVWVCSMMVLHLLWKLGYLEARWPSACWLCHYAHSSLFLQA